MTNILLTQPFKTTFTLIGEEHTPVLVIDDFVTAPELLVDLASEGENSSTGFQQQVSDYYPGIRKSSPSNYLALLSELLPVFRHFFNVENATKVNVIMSAFSISTTQPAQLRPIQMLPHFDTPVENQFAVVHYLCGAEHGGTSLYKHKASGFERITTARLAQYREQIKAQAMAEKLHESPNYIEGDTRLFKQLYSVDAKINRAVIYPSNALHSGNIRPEMGLLNDPKKGRLTISSFIVIN